MKKTKSILVIILCFAIVVSLFVVFIAGDQTAEASTSLPGIEQIKQTSGTFNILEIVPEAGSGSIGWYVDGQEPGANWVNDKLAPLTSKADRISTAGAYLTSLESAGLLGAAGTPLYKTGSYAEYAPWQDRSGITNLKTLTLSTAETYENTTGTFTPVAVGGEYRADNSYSVSLGGSGGNYDQDITALTLLSSALEGTHYYCTLGAFSALTAFDDVTNGSLIYRVVDYIDANADNVMDDPYDIIIKASDYSIVSAAVAAGYDHTQLIYLAFQGCMGSSHLTGLNLLADYFTVPFTVSTAYGAAPQFEAVAEGFVGSDTDSAWQGKGHFDAVTLSYTYVGLGSADAAYSYSSSGSNSYTVKTKTVYYTGGFTNNNWFLTYVLNWTTGETAPAITVSSKTSGSVTESDVTSADMIVLSNGRASVTTPYAAGNDISSAVSTAIQAASSSKLPVIVDNALRSQTGLNIGQLSSALTTGGATHYVSGNIYCIDTALATSDFNTEISGDHEVTGDPFYAVWYEINYENFLRRQNDSGAVTLPETVSIATCTRYIINYGGQRVITNKTSIRVLELQPGNGSHLTTTMVSGWTGISAGNITIDTLSTAEYIGKIDDLVEKYDMVYIGADLTGFTTTGSGSTLMTNYNDNDMDGLIYTNIGDTYVSGSNLTGLLDRDYSTSSSDYFTRSGDSTHYREINDNSASWTFRLSGNDITSAKVSELLDFAQAGYPVVMADNLMSGTQAADAFSFTAVLTESDGTLNAAAVATTGSSIPFGSTKTYQWYQGSAGSGTLVSSSGSSYTPDETGTYYCTITISGQTAVSNTADVTFTARPYIVTPRNPSEAIAADWRSNSGGNEYTITVVQTDTSSYDTYNTFEVSVSPVNYESISYQWYGKNNSGSKEKILSGETSSTFVDADNYYYYFCRVTINGCPLDSDIIYWNDPGTYNITHKIFNAGVSASISSSGVTLTATFNPAVGSLSQRRVRWYKEDSSYYYDDNTDPYSIFITEPGTYYCRARVNYSGNNYDAYSNYYTISGGGFNKTITVNTDYGSAATVPAVAASYTVSTATVDHSSKVYSFLNTVSAYANVFTETGAGTNSSTLVQYLNLSKPKIVFSAVSGIPCYPSEYTGPTGPSLSGTTLTYKFTIQNETDVTPADTRYYCNLYVDMNADGRYSYPSEQLADITITDGGGNVIRTGELKAGVEYTVTRVMPAQYVGIIPWQLEVVKTTQPRVHASQHNYTHITGTPTTIYILQVLDGYGTTGLNLATNSTYQSLFAQVNSDFIIDITTASANNLSGVGSGTVTRKDADGNNVTVSYANLSEYLNTFDMLILGFEDCYGDLDRTAANAVVAFINNPSGKSVLFTHDTTSFYNLPFNYRTTSGSYISTGWGYYFNTVLRDAVGLDRYGVTNPTYGITNFSPQKAAGTQTINVAAGAVTLGVVHDLEAAGYSIAYKPVSSLSENYSTTKTTLPEVQGFTSFNLRRYGQWNDNTTRTSVVSQVNEGQITTYPFNLNLYGFRGNTNTSNKTMTIAETHEQYYQLNMNPDDIVVWYCLAGGGTTFAGDYDDLPNDVVNAYYIYSEGNVTYSGSGHSGGTVVLSEAKLFVNTMIAAYQTAATPPAIKIIDPADATGQTELTDKFYVGDDTSILASSSSSLADSAIYFTVTDPSLNAGKMITASFTYDNNGTATQITLPIYVKGGSASPINLASDGTAAAYTLSGGVTYYVYPTSELLSYLQSNSRAVLTITITSNLLPGQPASAQVTLHELGLFPLD